MRARRAARTSRPAPERGPNHCGVEPPAGFPVHYDRNGVLALEGNMREVLARMEPETFTACVTDPPYELGFMGKGWDSTGIAFDPDTWRAVLRVIKPGAFALIFGGTRTFHRMACAVEDAGFEVRDTLMWMYGSGFPKSLDISKAIDRMRYDSKQVLKVTRWLDEQIKRAGVRHTEVLEAFGFNDGSGQVGHWTATTIGSQPTVPTLDQVPKLLDLLGNPDMPADIVEILVTLNGRERQPGNAWFQREVIGKKKVGIATPGDQNRHTVGGSRAVEVDITKPATSASSLWQGYGTALKPAWEPIIVAMKPLDGTFAENALKHGVAGLNVDGGRVGGPPPSVPQPSLGARERVTYGFGTGVGRTGEMSQANKGRWPANVIISHDERCVHVGTQRVISPGMQRGTAKEGFKPGMFGDIGTHRSDGYAEADGHEQVSLYACVPGCPVRMLDEQSGVSKSGQPRARKGRGGIFSPSTDGIPAGDQHGDTGTASRFFYTAKASTSERQSGLSSSERNLHPTVKPLDLMRYLLTLVTMPTDTLVLDPFMGSGSTLVAAKGLGVQCVGIDDDKESCRTAAARLSRRTAGGLSKRKKLKKRRKRT